MLAKRPEQTPKLRRSLLLHVFSAALLENIIVGAVEQVFSSDIFRMA